MLHVKKNFSEPIREEIEENLKFPQLNHSTSQENLLYYWLANERRDGGESQFSSTLSLNLPNTLFFSLAERLFLGGASSRFYSFSILAKGPDLFDWGLLSTPGRFLCSWYNRRYFLCLESALKISAECNWFWTIHFFRRVLLIKDNIFNAKRPFEKNQSCMVYTLSFSSIQRFGKKFTLLFYQCNSKNLLGLEVFLTSITIIFLQINYLVLSSIYWG